MSGVDLGNYKIHCATDNKRSKWRPLEQYYCGTFELGQSHQSQKNFECENILSLINLGNSRRWLYVGVYSVRGVKARKDRVGFIYDLRRFPGLEHIDGRAIIDFNKDFRASYLVGQRYESDLIVTEIRPEKMSIADFPGFNDVLLSFEKLKSIVRQYNPSWRTALSNISGVYVISDNSNGMQYVGSAYGGIGIWQRWSAYAATGHGGNKELRQLLRDHGDSYANNFQYSIVEFCDIYSSSEYIISRECHWKNVLLSREYGYNHN
jgi:hypothetical protein